MEQVSHDPDPPPETIDGKSPRVKVKRNNFFPNIVIHNGNRVNSEIGKKETSTLFTLVSWP